MKIVIPKQELLGAVNTVKSVVSQKTALPILSHILMEADKDTLKLTATDLKVSIECVVDCTVEESGALTVSSQRLSMILGELPDEDVSMELKDTSIVDLNCGLVDAKLFSISPDEYPPVRDFGDIEPIIFNQGVLKSCFSALPLPFARISRDTILPASCWKRVLTGCVLSLRTDAG